MVDDDPAELLTSTMHALATSRFTFPSDCTMANNMSALSMCQCHSSPLLPADAQRTWNVSAVGDFEFTIKMAVEAALSACLAGGELTAPPQVYPLFRQARSVQRWFRWGNLDKRAMETRDGSAREGEGVRVELVQGLTTERQLVDDEAARDGVGALGSNSE